MSSIILIFLKFYYFNFFKVFSTLFFPYFFNVYYTLAPLQKYCIAIVRTLFYNKYELKLLVKGEFYMATKSANLYARIEPNVKEEAETILSTLGIPASGAINMFYKQIILHRGLPFELKIPNSMPVDINTLSEEEFNNELEKGYADMQAGRTKNVNTVFADIRKDYGL